MAANKQEDSSPSPQVWAYIFYSTLNIIVTIFGSWSHFGSHWGWWFVNRHWQLQTAVQCLTQTLKNGRRWWRWGNSSPTREQTAPALLMLSIKSKERKKTTLVSNTSPLLPLLPLFLILSPLPSAFFSAPTPSTYSLIILPIEHSSEISHMLVLQI